MNSRTILEQHVRTLNALKRGGIRLGLGQKSKKNELQQNLETQWQTQSQLANRVLQQEGEPWDNLLEWRTRTETFLQKYPDRSGWTDRAGQQWDAQAVLDAIGKLIEEIETGLMSDDELASYAEEEEAQEEEEIYS